MFGSGWVREGVFGSGWVREGGGVRLGLGALCFDLGQK